jgi:hypothetical protein
MSGKLILAVLAAALLLAAHALLFGLAVRHLALPVAAVAALAVVALAKHMGLLGAFVAWLRRRPTPRS